MLIKAAVLVALIAPASQPLLAASPDAHPDKPVAKQAVAMPLASAPAPVSGKILVLRPASDVPGDIVGARGPDPHARELNAIAIYGATGNRDGAEILAAELAQFGIGRDDVQRSVEWVHVHGHSGRPATVKATGSERHAEIDWEASQ